MFFTQDSVDGDQQQSIKLWDNIFAKFFEETMNINDRDANGLSGRFIIINAQVALYIAALMQAARARASGLVDVDVERKCRTDWHHKHGKFFAYES